MQGKLLIAYAGQTVYVDIHNGTPWLSKNVYVEAWSDQVGVMLHNGVLYVVADIHYPQYGDIWHVVTYLPLEDAGIYREVYEAEGAIVCGGSYAQR